MCSKSAYATVRDASSRGRTGLVTVMCPKCYKIVRTYETQVNGFNEWSFKYDSQVERDEDGRLRTVMRYHSVTMDGRGCCF